MQTHECIPPNLHDRRNRPIRQRTLGEREAHGRILADQGMMPTGAVDRLLEDMAMRDIHGEGLGECDSNGGA